MNKHRYSSNIVNKYTSNVEQQALITIYIPIAAN